MFRKLRLALLLLILATVALGTWRDARRLHAWQDTIQVAVYPIAGDDSPATARHIAALGDEPLDAVSDWLAAEGLRYAVALPRPLRFHIEGQLSGMPPLPPNEPNPLDTIVWSLHLRYWAWQHANDKRPRPHIRLFLVFHDPDRQGSLAHSTALGKGQIGLIHVFASPAQKAQNDVVIAHELLHIFGATDKYDMRSLMPLFPDGYAEPERSPRLPQRLAEIMGGRIPLDDRHAEIPPSLSFAVVGPATAGEIGWRPH